MPANKTTATDSVGLAIQSANQLLIEGEDSVLTEYVQKNKLSFTKTSSGLWIKISKHTQGVELKDLDSCKIAYKILSLENKTLLTKTETIIIGKKQVINGLEEALLSMKKGEEALLLVPWYLGYGMKGDGNNISAYTSILINVQIIQ